MTPLSQRSRACGYRGWFPCRLKMSLLLSSVWLFQSVQAAVPAVDGEYPSSVQAAKQSQESQKTPPCSLYLAPSSIPGAGWGVFADRSYKMGDRIGTPSVGIPFLDMPTTNGDTTFIYGALSEYLWESADIGGFGEALRVDFFLPGPASLVNHHASLDNVLAGDVTQDSTFYRYTSPLAGASTAYTNFYLIAKRDIEAGEELFVDRTRNARFMHEAYLNQLPSAQDYERVDEMVQAIGDQGFYDQLTEAQFQDMLYRLAHEVTTVGNPSRARAVQALLPRDKEEFARCYEVGAARFRFVERSRDWIRSNGHCMDTVAAKPSKIPDGGHGAFATRRFSKGSIVSLSPMVTVANRKQAMEVPYTREGNTHPGYKFMKAQSDKTFVPETRANATEQLLANYCFGHEQSDLMLCPTTQAALMNHAGADRTPNVALRWSRQWSSPQDEPFTLQSLESIVAINQTDLSTYKTKLVMEYVALREIQSGEELLLDYSGQWEDAFKNHLELGHSSLVDADNAKRLSAKEMNELGKAITTSEKARPKHFAFLCNVYPNVKVVPGANPGWEDFTTNNAIDKSTWPQKFKAWYQYNRAAALYPCNVMEVNEAKGTAEIEMLVKPLSVSQIGRRYRNVPLGRIQYADSLYHSDTHLEWAFRHFLPIPDAIFPLHWRRDYKTAKDGRLGRYPEQTFTKSQAEDYEKAVREAKCGVYMAKSNIPNGGFGTYTAVDIPAAGILVATMIPAVPVFYPWHNFRFDSWSVSDYVWDAHAFAAVSFDGFPEYASSVMSVLFGAMANAHAGIVNLNHDMGEWLPMLDARKDYGAGAFSDHYNTGFRTTYAVAAGEELFVSYGENWFRTRKQFENIPLRENFVEANGILASVWAFLSTGGIYNEEELISKYLLLIRDHFVDHANKRTVTALNAVPTMKELSLVVQRNGTAEATVERRTPEWLEENGYCQDHIFVNVSTIPNAGHGAFLRRFRPKDSIIVSMPMVAMPLSVVTMKTERPSNEQQLLTNYLVGHKDSTVRFFPTNQAIAINHNSERMKNGKAPNARLQFSTSDKRSMYFQSLPLEDLYAQKYTTMVLDVIATRDIEPDEEIFFDFGEDWEKAWTTYVKNWRSPCGRDPMSCFASSKSVKEMNDDKFNTKFHAWSTAHMTTCKMNHTLLESEGDKFLIDKDIPVDFNQAIDPRRRVKYEGISFDHEGFDLPTYQWSEERQDRRFAERPCIIVGANREDQTFDVIFLMGVQRDTGGLKQVVRLKSLPDSQLRYHVRPFKTDIIVPDSFRHDIAIPDEHFPPLWKDLI